MTTFVIVALTVTSCAATPTSATLRELGTAVGWETRDPAPLVRQEFSATEHSGRLLVAGDLIGSPPSGTEMWWYDAKTSTWSQTTTLPLGYDHQELVTLGDLIYAIGGFHGGIMGEPRADVMAYDVVTEEWAPVASLPEPRGSVACAAAASEIYCAGGTGGQRGDPSATDIFVYDPLDDVWRRHEAELPTARDHAKAAIVGDMLWVVGGRSDGIGSKPTLAIEGLDLRTGEWTTGDDLPIPQSGGGLAAVDGLLIVFGGEGPEAGILGGTGSRYQVFEEAFAYDIEEDRWYVLPPLPTRVHGQAVAAIDGGEVHSIGGGVELDVHGTSLHQVLIVDLSGSG